MATKHKPPLTPKNIECVTLKDMFEDPQPIDWLWEGWIPQGTVASLSGVSGVGKSLLVATLEISVATGIGEFLGYPVAHGPVIHIGADVSRQQQQPHYRASAIGLGVLPDSQDIESLKYYDWRDEPFEKADFVTIREKIELLKPVLVVFDSWAACFPYANGNSSQDVANIMASLKSLSRMGPTILFIDHLPKPTGGDLKPEDRGPAGSHYKEGGSRASLIMTKVPKGSANGRDVFKLAHKKANLSDHSTLFVERNWKVNEKKNPTAIYHTVIKDLQEEIGAHEDNQIMNLAKRMLGEHAEGLAAKELVSKILKVVSTSDSSVRRALRELVKAKKIKETKTKGHKQSQRVYQLASISTE